jgi:hypothetical protein
MLANFITTELECWLQIVCTVWDSIEFWIVHKILALCLYYTGLWGATGAILWALEETILRKVLHLYKYTLTFASNVFGFGISMILAALTVNWLAGVLRLTTLFEHIYSLLNS